MNKIMYISVIQIKLNVHQFQESVLDEIPDSYFVTIIHVQSINFGSL